MLGCLGCCKSCLDSAYEGFLEESEPFSLPSPLPEWPKGKGFATGTINLGEIEVVRISKFDKISTCNPLRGKGNSVSFYKPIEIPEGFHCLGDYCQPNDRKFRGYLLAAKSEASDYPALAKPLNYTLVWNSDARNDGQGYIWLPNPPLGYNALGFVVTAQPDEPDVEEVRCVRSDLTEACEVDELMFDSNAILSKARFYVWNTRPRLRGMFGRGVPVGTFVCGKDQDSSDNLSVSCLRNLDPLLSSMPSLEQVHALIGHYGPTVYFHPEESYLPSSVPWFFEQGALLYEQGRDKGLSIDSNGSILPSGGINDGLYWLDLPDGDEDQAHIKSGDLESAELYVHVKPASGGAFTDIAMWIFCPFNGPASIKAGLFSYTFDRLGQHIGDWEHYTLRISNFEGELWSVYFSEHSGGEWLDASELEFISGNKSVVYASKHGHASFPHEGCYIQGSSKLKVGARNDCARSELLVDSSEKYRIVAAEYLVGDDEVEEPHWLQFMREWGPTVVYDSTSEIEKILKHLPIFVRFSLEVFIELFPTELYGEEGPTGPKEKDNWLGDERC